MDSRTKSSPVVAPVQSRFYWALGALVVVFGAVRFACLFNDLWLDEIWSLRLVQQLHSPAEILTRLWHDNNHPLNSLWLYLVMPAKADWIYRLLSWFTGTATVGLAGLIAHRQFQRLHPEAASGKAEAAGLFTAVVVGGSYFLIHYSSEARGYAPVVGFGFLAIYALLRVSGRPANAWAIVYGLACVLGLLSHLVAFQVMLGGLVWSAVALWTWPRWRDRFVHLVCWHLGPWIFLGLYYWGFVRHVEIGGGPQLALSNVLGTLAAFTLGFPSGLGVFVALPVFLSVSLLVLGLIWCRDRAIFGFYLTAIFIAPALGLCSSRFVLLYPRYFIVSAALALLLVGYALARLCFSGGMGLIGPIGRIGRMTGGVLLAGFLVGNGMHAARLLRDGRGQYQAALRYIAERTPTAAITVSSDSDFRNFGVMEYYKSVVGPGHQLQYYPTNQLPPDGPQWIFLHRLDESVPVPPDALQDAAGRNYRLVRVFPHAPLSGWEWYIYRNLDPTVLPAAP